MFSGTGTPPICNATGSPPPLRLEIRYIDPNAMTAIVAIVVKASISSEPVAA